MYLKATLIIVFSYLCLAVGYDIERHEDTIEAPVGETIILHCKSNDDKHNFMFWHLTNGEVIGPRNDFDNAKFKYEVLTGNLTIKGITENDAGTYSCISDGLDNRDVSVNSVNLLVKNEWNISKEKSTNNEQNKKNGNLWKVSAILGCIVLLLVMILLGIHFYNKEAEKPKYFDIIEPNDEDEDEDDEDSTEELFTREPSTSGVNKESNEADNFEKVYTTINMNNDT